LSGTAITDAGLEELTALIKLRLVILGNSNVTAQGIEKLQKSFPQAKIY
jgi:hypothetical protein